PADQGPQGDDIGEPESRAHGPARAAGDAPLTPSRAETSHQPARSWSAAGRGRCVRAVVAFHRPDNADLDSAEGNPHTPPGRRPAPVRVTYRAEVYAYQQEKVMIRGSTIRDRIGALALERAARIDRERVPATRETDRDRATTKMRSFRLATAEQLQPKHAF